MSTNIKINVENFYKFNQIAKLYMGNKNENNEVFVFKENKKNLVQGVTCYSQSLQPFFEFIASIEPQNIAVVGNNNPKPKSSKPR